MKARNLLAGVLLLLLGSVAPTVAREPGCQPTRGYSAYTWDFKHCRPCKQGERNRDGRGKCEKEERECWPARGYSAYDWDFERCSPCERGERNEDGRGRCESRHRGRDDRRGDRIGGRECQPARGYSAYDWDFERCQPCARGERNEDGKGGCERVCQVARGYSAYEWDFERCRPCERGERNRDGQGACERRGRGRDERECQPTRGYSANDWDFERCSPCARGERNSDGRGGCERSREVRPANPPSAPARPRATPPPVSPPSNAYVTRAYDRCQGNGILRCTQEWSNGKVITEDHRCTGCRGYNNPQRDPCGWMCTFPQK